MESAVASEHRWQLYKVLAEPQRLRLLCAASVEALSIGELAELLGESQSNVSRQLAPLRRLGLLSERKQGTRVFVQLDPRAAQDPVVNDALASGRLLCEADAVLSRIPALIQRRDEPAREFFARQAEDADVAAFPAEMPAYLAALSPLLPSRGLAMDIGTGDGRLLEVLAPVFKRVVAIDREQAQLRQAAARLAQRGYDNVELVAADLQGPSDLQSRLPQGKADVVFASRMLHHAPRPAELIATLGRLLRPGGTLIVLDYASHDDESLRDEQADLWLGFSVDELSSYVANAGLVEPNIIPVPKPFCGGGPDQQLQWQILAARKDS